MLYIYKAKESKMSEEMSDYYQILNFNLIVLLARNLYLTYDDDIKVYVMGYIFQRSSINSCKGSPL